MRKKIKFSIDSWSAWSTTRSSRSNWVDWANNEVFKPDDLEPDISFVPAMKRRRMSYLSKMALHTAFQCLQSKAEQPLCVFASQHGELTRTVKILEALVVDEDVSPTDFSLSVHNTALGLFSINALNQNTATTVAAGEDTFGFGLLEAFSLLGRFPGTPVLYVYFDEPVPRPLSDIYSVPLEAISTAFLLQAYGPNQLSIEFDCHSGEDFDQSNLAESFMQFLLSPGKESTQCTSKKIWRWARN